MASTNHHYKLMNWSKKHVPYIVLLLSAIVFLLLFSVTTSPLSVEESGDSTIYKLLGLGLLHGKIPYIDLFDNKGTYLYLINALGQWMIPGRWGIFILQIISLTATLLCLYRTALLFCGRQKALIIVEISLFLFAGCYQGGNHIEEWMLPFITLIFYLFSNFFINQRYDYSVKTIITLSSICGLCFGVVLMLRPNDAFALFGGVMVGFVLWLIYNKQYGKVIICSATFLLGAAFSISPILIWYGSIHALDDLWFAMFGVNSQVANGMKGQILTLLSWGKGTILLLMFTLCVMIYTAGQKKILWMIIPLCLLQWVFIGENLFAHYIIPLFPLILLYITMIFTQKNGAVLALSIAILLLSHRSLPRMALFNCTNSARLIINNWGNTPTHQCPIPEDERGGVWNYSADPWRPGVPMSWFVNNNIVQRNRKTGSHDIHIEEIDFESASPLWVVSYEHEFESNPISSNYNLVDSCVTNQYTLVFYKLIMVENGMQ